MMMWSAPLRRGSGRSWVRAVRRGAAVSLVAAAATSTGVLTAPAASSAAKPTRTGYATARHVTPMRRSGLHATVPGTPGVAQPGTQE